MNIKKVYIDFEQLYNYFMNLLVSYYVLHSLKESRFIFKAFEHFIIDFNFSADIFTRCLKLIIILCTNRSRYDKSIN